jgi:Flp pilus assembly protein TadD
LKQYEGAIADFSSALRIEPENSRYYFARGSAYLDIGDATNGRRDFAEVIKRQANNASAYYKRALSYMMRNKLDKALDDCQQALSLSPNNPDYLICLAELQIQLEAYPEAIAYLLRARLRQQSPRVLAGLAVAYYLNAQDKEANQAYNQLLEIDLAFGDIAVWKAHFGWPDVLLEAASGMIEAIEAAQRD